MFWLSDTEEVMEEFPTAPYIILDPPLLSDPAVVVMFEGALFGAGLSLVGYSQMLPSCDGFLSVSGGRPFLGLFGGDLSTAEKNVVASRLFGRSCRTTLLFVLARRVLEIIGCG